MRKSYERWVFYLLLEDINKEFLYDLEINVKNDKIKFNINFETIAKLLDFETNKSSIASTKYFLYCSMSTI